jgi:DNA polymerase-3 subunit gamma/tau
MLETIHSLDDQAPDYDQVLVELSSLLQRIALEQVVPGSATESGHDPDVVARLAAQLAADEIQLYYQMAIMGRRDLGLAPDPRTGFEMTMLRLLAFRPVTPGSEPTRTAAPPTSTPVSTGRTSPTPKPMPSATGTKSAEVGGSALAAGLPLSGEAWIEVAAALGLTGGAQQLAANCTWSGVSGSTLLLRLHAGKAGLHTAQMEERVQSALQQRFGATTRLVIEHSAGGEAMPADTLAQREADEQAERLAQAHAELILDPNVADLTRRFGAKVVADTVKPNH